MLYRLDDRGYARLKRHLENQNILAFHFNFILMINSVQRDANACHAAVTGKTTQVVCHRRESSAAPYRST